MATWAAAANIAAITAAITAATSTTSITVSSYEYRSRTATQCHSAISEGAETEGAYNTSSRFSSSHQYLADYSSSDKFTTKAQEQTSLR